MPDQIFKGQVSDVRNPLNPAFLAQAAAAQDNITGDDTTYTVLYDEVWDQAGNYDGASTFTAPVTGKYLLSALIEITGLTADHVEFDMRIITSNRTFVVRDRQGAGTNVKTIFGMRLSVVADMDANDTAYVTVTVGGAGGTKVVDLTGGGYSAFSGCLLC